MVKVSKDVENKRAAEAKRKRLYMSKIRKAEPDSTQHAVLERKKQRDRERMADIRAAKKLFKVSAEGNKKVRFENGGLEEDAVPDLSVLLQDKKNVTTKDVVHHLKEQLKEKDRVIN